MKYEQNKAQEAKMFKEYHAQLKAAYKARIQGNLATEGRSAAKPWQR